MPSLTGTLKDNAFELEEQNLASILDLPFDGFFISGDILEIVVVDKIIPTEFVSIQMFPVGVVEEVSEARGLPTKVREAQRVRQLVRLRKMLDDEEVLLLME